MRPGERNPAGGASTRLDRSSERATGDTAAGGRPEGGGPAAELRAELAAAVPADVHAELEASEARFRSIVEGNADGILIVDAEGVTRFVNPAAERMFGLDAAELLGGQIGIAIVPGETTEIDIVRRGRSEVVAELRATATTWEGAPAQLIMLRDITERRRSEERRQRLVWERAARAQAEDAVRRAQFLAEAGAALDASLDPHVTLRRLSELIVPRMADWCMIDLQEGDRIRRVAAVHRDADRLAVLDELRRNYPVRAGSAQPAARVLETGEAELRQGMTAERLRALAVDEQHAELLLRLGTRSWIAAPLLARGRRLGVITLVCGERDFTEADLALTREVGSRAGQALENARLYEAALAANRAKSDFLAIMSHELRTPLNAILGYTQLLLEEIPGELDEPQRRQLERVSASATHLLRIINDILVFASMESGRLQLDVREVGLAALVQEVAVMVEPLFRAKPLHFGVEVRDGETVLVTDPTRLRQILLNLLSNAAKFTDAGSVTLRARADGGDVIFEVADTGPGIPESWQEAVFEPFRQVEGPLTRHDGGTGLGLSLARRMTGLLGGRLDLDSELHVGSTFTLRLPRAGRSGGVG